MKRKVGKRKKQLQQKYFFRRLLLTEGILIIAAVIILGGVFLVKRIRENVNTVSMVEEASGLDKDDSNSLAAVKAAMARPAEFSPKCVDSTRPSLYIETTDIEVDGQILANASDYTATDTHSFDAGILTQFVNSNFHLLILPHHHINVYSLQQTSSVITLASVFPIPY